MEVVERFLQAKTGRDSDCEDGIVVTNSLAAVIDGATDKTGHRFHDATGGRHAMLACADAVRSLDGRADALRSISHLTSVLAERLPAGLPADEHPEAAITIYSDPRREIWQVGDVGFWYPGMPDRMVQHTKAIDRYAAILRAAVLRAELAHGADHAQLAKNDPGRAAISSLLARQGIFRNRRGLGRWAYGAIDGLPVPPELVAVHRIPDGAGELILASDGYPILLPTLDATERMLARLLAQDPLCLGPLRGTKGIAPGNLSFDDRAYLRLRL